MKNKLFTFIPLVLLLAACNPVFNDSSETGSDSSASSGSDSTSETSSGSESSSESGSGSSESSSSEDSSITPPPAGKTVEELCDEMNNQLKSYGLDYINAYSARNYLLLNDYGYLVSPQEDDKFFGFDGNNNNIAVYKMNNNECIATYPQISVGRNVTSYQSINASSLLELNSALTNIESKKGNYSTIKLTNNLTITNAADRIVVNTSNPVELDLNSKSIDANVNTDLVSITGDDAVFSIKNGTLSTFSFEGYDMNISPRCIYVGDGDMVLIDNMTLNANAFCGYGYINEIGKSTTKTLISNSTINAITVAICIQDGVNYIQDNTIDGILDINGGETIVDNCDITAVGHKDDADGFVTNEYVTSFTKNLVETHSDLYDTYIISSVDPIFILDRRSVMGTYSSPDVKVSNCRLTADYDGDVIYGYGVRYIDLKLGDPAQLPGTIDLGDSTNNYNGNIYVKCSSSNPNETVGGFTKYTAN